MRKNEQVVIDNDTQEIYVDGKKWEPSPVSYSFLSRFRYQKPVEVDPNAATAYLDHCLAMARQAKGMRHA